MEKFFFFNYIILINLLKAIDGIGNPIEKVRNLGEIGRILGLAHVRIAYYVTAHTMNEPFAAIVKDQRSARIAKANVRVDRVERAKVNCRIEGN